MKRGDLVCWRSDLMYGLIGDKPMIVLELSSLGYDVRVVEPSTGHTEWVLEEDLYILSA